MVTAVSAEPLKYYSWLLAGLLDSGRFRFKCQDSLCSAGSPVVLKSQCQMAFFSPLHYCLCPDNVDFRQPRLLVWRLLETA